VGSTQCASGTIVVTKQGSDGRDHSLCISVEVWGKKAESVSELVQGTLVMVEGKLSRRKNKQEQWEWVISAYDMQPVSASSLRQAASLAQTEDVVKGAVQIIA
jgi:single-stranded DNA-binding protein